MKPDYLGNEIEIEQILFFLFFLLFHKELPPVRFYILFENILYFELGYSAHTLQTDRHNWKTSCEIYLCRLLQNLLRLDNVHRFSDRGNSSNVHVSLDILTNYSKSKKIRHLVKSIHSDPFERQEYKYKLYKYINYRVSIR